MKSNLSKEDLYNSVKQLLDLPENHYHLGQQKIYTLFSIGFQYLMYSASKEPGIYIIRAHDRPFAEKLARKAKDSTTRKFMSRILLNRKLRYENSYFFLDFFNFPSWSLTATLPKDKIKKALIIKSTSTNPLMEENELTDNGEQFEVKEFGENYYVDTLKEICPETFTISYGAKYNELNPVEFDFIPEPEEVLSGVKISDPNLKIPN